MSDATQPSVSAEAENKVTKENSEVAHVEAAAGAQVIEGGAATDSEFEFETEGDKPKEIPLSAREQKIKDISDRRAIKQADNSGAIELSNEQMGLPDDYNSPDQGGIVTLNVKGKEKDFTAEKVLDAGKRALQKESTADVKLEEAGIKLKAANARMDELDIREQNILKQQQDLEASRIGAASESMPSATADVSMQDEDLDAEAEKLTSDLYSGNKKKAEEAMKTILGRSNTATPGIQNNVTAEDVAAVVQKQNDAKALLSRFNTAFPGISKDNNLQNIVNNESHRIAREHPEYNQDQLLMASGKYVSDNYGISSGDDDGGFNKKAARKSQSDNVSGADVTRMPQEAKKQMSRKEAIADMKSRRR